MDKKKIAERIFFILIGISAALIVSIGVIAIVLRENGKKSLQADETEITVHSVELEKKATVSKVEKDDDTIMYKGKKYRYNKDVVTILFMGIDNNGKLPPKDENRDYRKGGQADALLLAVINPHDNTVKMVNINRNAIAEVDIYDENGNFVETRATQVCLAHGYGTGYEDSCERQVKSVSNLFNYIPISGYISMEMGGVGVMNDAVGGVEVEILDDIPLGSDNLKHRQGETVTLMGDDARIYVKYRDTKEFDSVSTRMRRQKQYVNALTGKLVAKSKKDAKFPITLLMELSDYTVTNLDASKITYLTGECIGYDIDTENIYSLEGETVVAEDGFEEFHADEEAVTDLIFELFYENVL